MSSVAAKHDSDGEEPELVKEPDEEPSLVSGSPALADAVPGNVIVPGFGGGENELPDSQAQRILFLVCVCVFNSLQTPHVTVDERADESLGFRAW